MNNTDLIRSAEFSDCGQYRYRLSRTWSNRRVGKNKTVAFIGLNPSLANAEFDDPTIKRCIAFAESWDFKRLIMINLFAYISTDPNRLLNTVDPVGPENDDVIEATCAESAKLIACWGNHGILGNRSDEVCQKFSRRLYCIRANKSGEPAHPLYLPATLSPYRYRRTVG